MYKMTIKLNIVIIVILLVALVCSMETYALHLQEESFLHQDTTKESPEGGAASKYNDKTIDAAAQLTEVNEYTNELPSVVSEERQEAERTATRATYVPYENCRVVAIGNLPADHDPVLVLREGRIIKVSLIYDIMSNNFFNSWGFLRNKENIYDDSNQLLLIPEGIWFRCAFRMTEEQDKVRISITVIDMYLEIIDIEFPAGGIIPLIMFTTPPYYPTRDGWKALNSSETLRSTDIAKRFLKIDYAQLREQLFLSPVMSAELFFDVKSEDRASEHGRVIFGENTSGDRTLLIGSGYRFDLKVNKDILFSDPYVRRSIRSR